MFSVRHRASKWACRGQTGRLWWPKPRTSWALWEEASISWPPAKVSKVLSTTKEFDKFWVQAQWISIMMLFLEAGLCKPTLSIVQWDEPGKTECQWPYSMFCTDSTLPPCTVWDLGFSPQADRGRIYSIKANWESRPVNWWHVQPSFATPSLIHMLWEIFESVVCG